MTRYARLNSPDPFVRARLQAALYKNRRRRLTRSTGGGAPLRLVATRAATPDTLNASFTQLYSYTEHDATDDITSIRARFANYIVNVAGEQGTGADATLHVGIAYPLGSTPIRMPFSGADSGVIASGADGETDEVEIAIPQGGRFSISVLYENSAGIISRLLIGNNAADRQQASTGALTDLTTTTTKPFMLTTSGYAPVALIARTREPSVLLLGDSLVRSSGDTSNIALKGLFERSLGSVGFTNAARSAAQARTINTAGAFDMRAILGNNYCTAVLSNFGINDVLSNRTAEQILADLEAIATLFDVPFYQTTITPSSTSTDGWATVENQTANAKDAVRVAVNTALRAGVPWAAGIFDVASVVESSLNSGLWKAGYTSDGTHPNATGYQAVEDSEVIDATAFV